MAAPSKNQTLFDLSGGHPALDLVNSLDNRFRADGPNENLRLYSDLLRFLGESGLLDPERIRRLNDAASRTHRADQVLGAVRALREATAAVFYAATEDRTPAPADIQTLERHFNESARHRELHWQVAGKSPVTDDTPGNMAWQWTPHAATDPNFPLWLLAQSVSDILLSPDAAKVRTCAVDTCRWLFLDTSKNHTRRWCNMRVCGNRMKARRFQARRET